MPEIGATVAGWARRRPTAAVAVVYLGLSLVMFAPGFAPGRTLSASDYFWYATPWDAAIPAGVPTLGSNREQSDAPTQFQPPLQVTRASLPHIPLWDPNQLSGRPLIADPQAAIFSPFSVPAYVLPFWRSLALIAALKLFVAALGAFALGRALGMRFGGALLAGLVFGFSLWSVTWVSWTVMSVWAFLPWICVLAERCVRRPGPLPVAGLGAAVAGSWLGGHPSSSFQILAVVTVAWIVRALASPALRRGLAPRLLALLGGLILGTAAAAVMLIPFAELLSRSSDLAIRTQGADFHQPVRYLLGIFLHDWWGRGQTALKFNSGLEEHAYYVAALPLTLAAAALVIRPRWERVAVAGAGAGLLAVATGLPPLYDIVVRLPGFEAANNGRLAVVAVLCLAVLAGWGVDELTARAVARRRGALVAFAVGLLVLPVVIVAPRLDLAALGPALRVAWTFASPTAELSSGVTGGREAVVHLAAALEWLGFAGAALVLVALRLRGRLGDAAWVALAVLLVAADLFRAGMGYNPAIPLGHAVQPTTPAIRFLRDQRPNRFAVLRPRAPIVLATPMPPNVAMRYGLYDARGYVIPAERRYFELWRGLIAPDAHCQYIFCFQVADSTPRALRALGLLGVTHLLQNHGDPPLAGLPLAYAGRDARIYRNPWAVPRAFLVDRQVVVPDGEAALAAVGSPGFRVRRAAVSEERIPGVARGGAGSARLPGRAAITTYDRERVVVDVRPRRAALLVLTDNWYPGWKARVDGAEAPVHRVDDVLRGVAVPPGTHRVEFTYEPGSWRAGWILSLLALASLAALTLIGLRRRRREGGSPA